MIEPRAQNRKPKAIPLCETWCPSCSLGLLRQCLTLNAQRSTLRRFTIYDLRFTEVGRG